MSWIHFNYICCAAFANERSKSINIHDVVWKRAKIIVLTVWEEKEQKRNWR